MEHPFPVKLNVGGPYFTTSVQTLTKDPNSMLAALFGMKPCEDGSFFIDRDGTHFRFILNYLRTGKLTLPEGATFLRELEEEGEFYQIQGMVNELKLMSKNLAIVNLNVGGHHFTTSIQTLTKDPNSMLAAMFSGKFDVKRTSDGTCVIDRDGTHFRYILNYLRDGEMIWPDHEEEAFLKELEAEAKYYQIQGILDELRLNSEILRNEEHRSQLLAWLPPQKGECRLRLLLRASRDGFAAATFHSKCDNKGPTVAIVKSGNYIFGGFTDVSWHSREAWVACGSEAFLFSMVNPCGLGPTKLAAQGNEKGILCYEESGPTFGSSGDAYELHISDNANIKSSSCSRIGRCFTNPLGWLKPLFTERNNFIVTNYEVFRLCN